MASTLRTAANKARGEAGGEAGVSGALRGPVARVGLVMSSRRFRCGGLSDKQGVQTE